MRYRRHISTLSTDKTVLTPDEVERRLHGAPLTDLNKLQPVASSGGAVEAQQLMQRLSSTTTKGTLIMPDIQTALKNAINTWEPTPINPVQQLEENTMQIKPVPFSIQNNVTRVTFDYVKQHPGTRAVSAARDLVKLGFKESSVTSLMAQFVRTGLAVRDKNGGYRVTQEDYVPMKAKQKKQSAPAPSLKSGLEGIAALRPEGKKMHTLVLNKSPQDITQHLTVYQAKELYDHLKQLFGG